MKKLFIALIVSCSCLSFQAQKEEGWVDLLNNDPPYLEVRDSVYQFENLTLEGYEWREDIPNEDGYEVVGLRELRIFRNGKYMQSLYNIGDDASFDSLVFYFYDFNMDGHLDFRIRRTCGKSCFYSYYFFDPKTEKFIRVKDWDYIRPALLSKQKKQFWEYPEGTAEWGYERLYQVKGVKLKIIKEIKYGDR